MAGTPPPAPGVLVTRAEPGAQETAARLRELGYAPVLAPMLRVVASGDSAPEIAGAQAVLLTSPNGARVWAQAGGRLDLPALCVGEGTRDAAHAAGFAQVEGADGDAGSLAALARARLRPAGGALVWPAGADIARDLADMLGPDGFDVRRVVMYRAQMADALPDAARAALAGESGAGTVSAALLHSARAAQALSAALRRSGLISAAASVAIVCISARVAAAAGDIGWARIVVADTPTERGLLAALAGAVTAPPA